MAHSDDLLSPDKIAMQVAKAEESGSKRTLISCGWVQFLYRYYRAKSEPTALWRNIPPGGLADLCIPSDTRSSADCTAGNARSSAHCTACATQQTTASGRPTRTSNGTAGREHLPYPRQSLRKTGWQRKPAPEWKGSSAFLARLSSEHDQKRPQALTPHGPSSALVLSSHMPS